MIEPPTMVAQYFGSAHPARVAVRRGLAAALLAAASLPAVAEPADLARSSIAFGFKQEGVPGQGRFRRFTADVVFDPVRPEATRATIDVDTTSIDLGDPQWNSDLQSPSWFATKTHPKASFVAGAAKASGGGHFEAPGRLTLKGVTRDVTVAFTAKADPSGMLVEGTVPVRRLDFRIGDGGWADTSVVADEVAIRFKLLIPKK
jgi:polyisoprenoid-binding protein YceI